MKKICATHERAYEVDQGCIYCDDLPKTNETKKSFPGTLNDLIQLALADPYEASDLMDEQFGTQWQSLDDKKLGELITKHYSKRQLDIDYNDFATVTND